MNVADLQRYLREHIPITDAMGVSVQEASEQRVVLSAPLAPNVNHRQTAFGGSISSLATVAAWSWLHIDSHRQGIGIRLVIRSNHVEYLSPVEGDFVATCETPAPAAYDGYHDALRRKGKARIEMSATVTCEGKLAATFVGTFVALRHDGA